MKTMTTIGENEMLKMSIITTITMLQNAIKTPYIKFYFEELWNCEIENLESIRDAMVIEYNKQFAQG